MTDGKSLLLRGICKKGAEACAGGWKVIKRTDGINLTISSVVVSGKR